LQRKRLTGRTRLKRLPYAQADPDEQDRENRQRTKESIHTFPL
jgi:hypothetical protein